MNFQDYLNLETDFTLNEAKMITIRDLMHNFDTVFPHSSKESKVVGSYEKDQGLTLLCRGIVKSQSSSKIYQVNVQFHRNDAEEPWNVEHIGEVKCQCNAYRYNVAYPNVNTKTHYGRPAGNNRIPNKVRNPKKIPSVCKHIYAYVVSLVKKNVIKMNK